MRRTRVPVNLTLSEDLVREARMLTADLSKTVEQLLTTYIAREQSKRAEEQHAIDAVIAATNEYVTKYGLPGEDYSPL